jgi:hypothetical protein
LPFLDSFKNKRFDNYLLAEAEVNSNTKLFEFAILLLFINKAFCEKKKAKKKKLKAILRNLFLLILCFDFFINIKEFSKNSCFFLF